MVKIYALKNTKTGRVYVGCTKYKLSKRLREHRCLLRNCKHNEAALQAEWNEHGEASFVMIVLQELPEDVTVAAKRAAEIAWMDSFKLFGHLLNGNTSSFAPTPAANKMGREASQTPEVRARRRLSLLASGKARGAKISATKQAQRLAKI